MQKPDWKGFLLLLFWHAALYAAWSIPAWILLVLHFTLGLPIVWFWFALGLWALVLLLRALLIVWTRYCVRRRTPVPGNKNPYSQRVRDPYAALRAQQGEQGKTPFSIEPNNGKEKFNGTY